MVGTVALAALVLGQSAPSAGAVPGCALVAPNGDAIAFQIVSGASAGDEMWLVAKADSVWPNRTLVGDRAAPGSDSFVFGGERGLVVQMGDAEGQVQTIFIRRREGNRIGLPLAYGYCRPEASFTIYRALDPSVDEDEIGAEIPAFDPLRWPHDDCGLILSDSRRLRLRYRLRDAQNVEVQNAELWGRRPVSMTLTQGIAQGRRPVRSILERRGGPSGYETFFAGAGDANGVKLITFRDLGGEAARGRAGFAICGYREMTRRAAPQ